LRAFFAPFLRGAIYDSSGGLNVTYTLPPQLPLETSQMILHMFYPMRAATAAPISLPRPIHLSSHRPVQHRREQILHYSINVDVDITGFGSNAPDRPPHQNVERNELYFGHSIPQLRSQRLWHVRCVLLVRRLRRRMRVWLLRPIDYPLDIRRLSCRQAE
jgi:hypothetical protein